MSGFTPGPWAVNPFSAQIDSQVVSAKGGLLPVAQLLWPTEERSEAETEANARLIAAAPDMLDVLLELFQRENGIQTMLGGNPNAVSELEQRAFAAIAKATGDVS